MENKITKKELKIAGFILSSLVLLVILLPNRGGVVWPLVVGILALLFGIAFKTEISEFLKGDWRFKTPSGWELGKNQTVSPEKEEKQEKTEMITLTEEDQQSIIKDMDVLGKYINHLEEQVNIRTSEKERIANEYKELFTKKHREVLYWFFSYCNLFFEEGSQMVF